MRPPTTAVTLLALGVLAASVTAQHQPDFTGAWTTSAAAAADDVDRASLGNGWGESFTLIQEASTLTVERVLYRPRDYQPTLRFRYALDGSESRNTIMMGRGMQIQVSAAAWEDDNLVITMLYDVPDTESGGTVTCEVTQTLSLLPPQEPAGEASLVIETKRCGVLGGIPSTTRTVYTRY